MGHVLTSHLVIWDRCSPLISYRDRIDGVDSAHNDTEDVHVTFWLSPRIDMGNPSTEAAIISLDKAVVAGQFKIGDLVAVSGR